jgi:16S rRNA (cytosine967-C5)-methyltransferase
MTARVAARDILLRIEAAGQYADRALDAALSRAGDLSREDRALFTTLVYGTIEHRITLDAVIDGLATVAPSAIERGVRMTLRVALYQLIYLSRIPDHAAINEAVEMTSRRTKGFVNAILRSFCRGGKKIPLPDPDAEPTRYLSVCYSVPERTAQVFSQVFGYERAASILAAFATHAPITVIMAPSKNPCP